MNALVRPIAKMFVSPRARSAPSAGVVALGLISLGLAGLAAPSVACAAAPDLLGSWRFDEGHGDVAEDASGNGYTAELFGADWARGDFGTALHLRGGDSCAVIPQLDGLDGSNELSVEAWVMWEAGGQYPNILTGGQWSPGGWLIFVADKTCSFRMGRPGAAADGQTPPWSETSATLVPAIEFGRWYHLSATFKRPQIITYVDGRKVGAATWDYPVGYKGDVRVGQWNGAVSHQGLIDELKIYRRALSAEEIAAEYAATAKGRAGVQRVVYRTAPATSPSAGTLENRVTKLEFDVRGRLTALIEKRSGQNLLTTTAPLATLQAKGRTLNPTACELVDGQLRLRFGSAARAAVTVAAADQYLVFEVAAVEGDEIDSFTFLALPIRAGKYWSNTSGAVSDDDWGVCLRELNSQAEVHVGGPRARLWAVSSANYGLVGAKAGLVVAPADELRAGLLAMVEKENLPQSSLGGPRALDAEGIRGSYLFTHPSERGVERWIDLAKRGGFTHLHFDGWYKSLGHYEPNPRLFPSGIEGMKSMVAKVHAAGLRAGMHTLTGCIQTNDPWVTPVPDTRLAADATYTLAADMDETADTIPINEMPQAHDVIWSYSGRGNAIRIGEEIIQYAAISREPPYAFLKCTRGAFNTKPSAHRRGEAADHLRQIYLAFYPDERTTLVGEVADAIAHVYNECEFDQIYMDGAEGMGSLHAIQAMRNAIYQRLRRPAVVEASCWDHWSWYYHSRIGAWDHPQWGLKPFTDLHCASIVDYRRGALLQAQMGWWVVLGPSPSSRAETPDEMEYFCAKTLAFDAPSSTQGIGSPAAPANARMQEYLTMAGWYERLRLANYFAESVKEQLRQPGKDFHLVQAADGHWQLLPTEYTAHKSSGLDDGSAAWSVVNPYAAQPLKLRLEALYSVEPYDAANGVLVADASSVDRFTVRRTASGVTQTFERSTDQVKTGEASLRYSATNTGSSRSGAWAHVGMRFEAPYFSIMPCDALGVWIHGDGKGEVLNLQLTSPREYMAALGEHYVTIDFKGWRYFEIPLRERDSARHRDYQWPYGGMAPIYMTAVRRDHIDGVNLYLNNLPPNDSATVYLGPIRALRTARTQLGNPTLAVGGRKVTFPTTLRSGDYLEFVAPDDCRVYDERGALLQRLAISAPALALEAGANELGFSCDPPDGLAARVEVTIAAHGPPLTQRNPDDQIHWERLRDEYDAPRGVTKLDGRENVWDVVCRAGSKPVAAGFEMDVEQIQATDAAYNAADALVLDSFDDELFGQTPQTAPAEPRYDAKAQSNSALPGVTQELELSAQQVKIGKASVRYTATSSLPDNSGWSVRGGRYRNTIDLSQAQAIGFWLYGDGKGEAFKLQLRDHRGGWLDLVTPVNFVGWQYQQFGLSGPGNLDLAHIQGLLIYYNSIPAKQTVTCYVDDIRALFTVERLRNPTLTVGDQRVTFPVELEVGDRLVFDGGQCLLHRGANTDPQPIAADGRPLVLQGGRNRAALSFDGDLLPRFRVGASLVKHYEP